MGQISLRKGSNSVIGDMYEHYNGGQMVLVKYELDTFRGIVTGEGGENLGGVTPGTQVVLVHGRTLETKGTAEVVDSVPITPEGFKRAEQNNR